MEELWWKKVLTLSVDKQYPMVPTNQKSWKESYERWTSGVEQPVLFIKQLESYANMNYGVSISAYKIIIDNHPKRRNKGNGHFTARPYI